MCFTAIMYMITIVALLLTPAALQICQQVLSKEQHSRHTLAIVTPPRHTPHHTPRHCPRHCPRRCPPHPSSPLVTAPHPSSPPPHPSSPPPHSHPTPRQLVLAYQWTRTPPAWMPSEMNWRHSLKNTNRSWSAWSSTRTTLYTNSCVSMVREGREREG